MSFKARQWLVLWNCSYGETFLGYLGSTSLLERHFAKQVSWVSASSMKFKILKNQWIFSRLARFQCEKLIKISAMRSSYHRARSSFVVFNIFLKIEKCLGYHCSCSMMNHKSRMKLNASCCIWLQWMEVLDHFQQHTVCKPMPLSSPHYSSMILQGSCKQNRSKGDLLAWPKLADLFHIA